MCDDTKQESMVLSYIPHHVCFPGLFGNLRIKTLLSVESEEKHKMEKTDRKLYREGVDRGWGVWGNPMGDRNFLGISCMISGKSSEISWVYA